MWINKGLDRGSVSLNLDFERIVSNYSGREYASVLCFHNHPNGNPNNYNLSRPSEQDIQSADYFWKITKKYKMNLLEYVCERGVPYRYYFKVIQKFYSIKEYLKEIEERNNKTKTGNYKLHMEKRNLSKIRFDIDN